MEEGRGPRVPRSKGSKVQGSQGPKDQDISNSNSNTSLTLKKVHLVQIIFIYLSPQFVLDFSRNVRNSSSTEKLKY